MYVRYQDNDFLTTDFKEGLVTICIQSEQERPLLVSLLFSTKKGMLVI